MDRFPSYVREWVKDKTGKTSVPQIFFNEVHIGGNKELQAILDDPAQKETVLDHLQRELGDNSPLLPNPGEMLNDKDDTYDEFTCEKSVLSTLVESLLSSNILGWNKRVRKHCLNSFHQSSFNRKMIFLKEFSHYHTENQ